MKLYIFTQDQENYGAHDWDGEGEVPQYWKMKGGTDYIVDVEGFRWNDSFADKNLRMIVDELRFIIDESNDFYRSNIIGFEKVEDDYQTWLEKSQMEYDGEIKYPAIRKTYNEMMLVNLENV
jgi:hypothetical protein